MTQTRDSHGRFTAEHHRARTIAIGATAAIGAVAAGIAAALHFGRRDAEGGEHAAPDLAPGQPTPGTDGRRAPVAFRPDPTAVPTRAERDGLRPATGPSPSMMADRGELAGQSAPANG